MALQGALRPFGEADIKYAEQSVAGGHTDAEAAQPDATPRRPGKGIFMFGVNFEPTTFFGFMLGFVVGTTFHEFMHAYSALLLGDTTAQRQGRVTLNPAAHFDPFGFIMGVLLALGLFGLAWGKPVPVNPGALRFGRRGMAIVAVAGPLSNLVFSGVLVAILKLGGALPIDAQQIIVNMILINLLLFSFNLIPIPPLDGFQYPGGYTAQLLDDCA